MSIRYLAKYLLQLLYFTALEAFAICYCSRCASTTILVSKRNADFVYTLIHKVGR